MCDSPSILADIAGALGFGAPDVESAATRSAVVGGYATEQGASRRVAPDIERLRALGASPPASRARWQPAFTTND